MSEAIVTVYVMTGWADWAQKVGHTKVQFTTSNVYGAYMAKQMNTCVDKNVIVRISQSLCVFVAHMSCICRFFTSDAMFCMHVGLGGSSSLFIQ